MRMQQEYKFNYTIYNNLEELTAEDKQLVIAARDNTKNAFAPYSKFNVSAVAKMKSGNIYKATNQENASFPVGICAERALLSVISSYAPNEEIETLVVSYDNKNGKSNHPISPCGMCRQALVEYEGRTAGYKVIMTGQEGGIIILENAKSLLPFSFSSDDMK